MKKEQNGYLTIFLALILTILLSAPNWKQTRKTAEKYLLTEE